MGATIHEHFVLYDKNAEAVVEMYINSDGDIFVYESNNRDGFFFVIKKKDWGIMKIFIDEQFENFK